MVTLHNPLPDQPLAIGDTPATFWLLQKEQVRPEDWLLAIERSMHELTGLPVTENGTLPADIVAAIQSESQFGPQHWQLGWRERVYYQLVRPLLPGFLRPFLHILLRSRQQTGFLLRWPGEDRYVRFMFSVAARMLASMQLDTLPYIHFWPGGKRFAFVLTHDIETGAGQRFVRQLARLDEKYGFRSSFNFVPEKYHVDLRLIEELKQRGFEVGVHGLKHDGRLFFSKALFAARGKRINHYLHEWDATGFRSPMTHRNPEWMQALDIEYDASFFDTDPYEPIPGGSMSIWPFQMGRFIELPYTLAQDHTLMNTLRETTPQIWLEKVAFIRKYCGLALVNTHPDYLLNPAHFAIYEDFLRQMSQMNDHWHPLPRDVAHWWKKRSALDVTASIRDLDAVLPGAAIGMIRRFENEIKIEI